jgi:hypothetical protein
MVRDRRTRDDRQFSTGSGRLERRNTLLPGVDLLWWWVTEEFSSVMDAREWSKWPMNDLSFDGVPPRPYILDRGALDAGMITTYT